jgi:hypothetical protein
VVGNSTFNQIMIQAVEERLDVQIDDPVELPAALPRQFRSFANAANDCPSTPAAPRFAFTR